MPAILLALSIFCGAELQFFDSQDHELSDGMLYTYIPGTTTAQITYADSARTAINPNPIVLDSNGRVPCQIWVEPEKNIKFVLTDKNNMEIATYNQVKGCSISVNKSREMINVKDFGAKGTKVDDDTQAVLEALDFSKRTHNRTLYFPSGNYTVQKAIQLDGGYTVKGDSLASTNITRTLLQPDYIGGDPNKWVFAVFYVTNGWNHISDMSISGVPGSTTGTVTGIQFGYNIAAKGSVKNIAINFMLYGINEYAGVFLYPFDNVQAVSCGYGFNFNSETQKTSLTFNQCYAANTGPAYRMNRVNYSVMNSCAADNCNWGPYFSNNQYGNGYGEPMSSEGIYTFKFSDFVLNSIGAEGSYGNGVINTSYSHLTINNMFSYDCKSTYIYPVANYVYAVGPIQCTTTGNSITINNAYNRVWTNTSVPPNMVSKLLAFNFDPGTATTLPNGIQVFIASSEYERAEAVKGSNPEMISKYVVSTFP